MQARSLSENTVLSLWEIILQVQNHVLPTNGTAKFFSALSVDDFIKKSSIVYYSKAALRDIHKDIIQFATSEQLTAHANSIAVRFEEERIIRTRDLNGASKLQ